MAIHASFRIEESTDKAGAGGRVPLPCPPAWGRPTQGAEHSRSNAHNCPSHSLPCSNQGDVHPTHGGCSVASALLCCTPRPASEVLAMEGTRHPPTRAHKGQGPQGHQ